jgi:arginine decarboxylase
VYPIKVNQQRHVVEEILEYGRPHGVGLECGSKPELQAVLALSDAADHLIVCNGYKDHEFMRLALMGQKVGHDVFIVIEQLSEVDVLLEVAEELGVRPAWASASSSPPRAPALGAERGEKSKFGLNAAQLVELVDRLRARGARDAQAPPLPPRQPDPRHPLHQGGAAGGGAFYVELRSMGVDVTHVDVGGGPRRRLRRHRARRSRTRA